MNDFYFGFSVILNIVQFVVGTVSLITATIIIDQLKSELRIKNNKLSRYRRREVFNVNTKDEE